ncbi:MAG: hypothetical protein WC775_03580 [Patescibacteria group bacterium]
MGISITDPTRLGTLEVGWWKAHNEKNKPEMVKLLTEQNMLLYKLDEEEAEKALQLLAGGVKFHDTREWDKAIDEVTKYYALIKSKTGAAFNPEEMGKLEVAWWQLHDKLEHELDKTELARLFALLYATQFGVDVELLTYAGELKAAATYEHDLAEDPNTPLEDVDAHWDKAKGLLVGFYEELKKVTENPIRS